MAKRRFLTISIVIIIISALCIGIKTYQVYSVTQNIDSYFGGGVNLNYKTGASDVAGFGEGCLLYVYSYDGQLDKWESIKDCEDDMSAHLSYTSYNPRLKRLYKELYNKYQDKNVELIYKSGDEISGELIFADKSLKLIYYLDYAY